MDEILKERYELAKERIAEFAEEDSAYFKAVSHRCAILSQIADLKVSGKLDSLDLESLKKLNLRAYEEVFEANYASSFANPAYACAFLDAKTGKVLSALYAELIDAIVYAYAGNVWKITILFELVLMVHSLFSTGEASATTIKNAIYYYHHDYCHELTALRQREMRSPANNVPLKILRENDLSKTDYLYKLGLFVSDSEVKTHDYLETLSEEQITSIATTFTGGYARGFAAAGIDYSERKIVELRYPLGFERIIMKIIDQFEAEGKSIVMHFEKSFGLGVASTAANKQFDYDHRNDKVLYTDARYKEVYLNALEEAFKELKEDVAVFAGPACLESFGEADFEFVNKPECLKPDDMQSKLFTEIRNDSATMLRKYLDMTKRSFTIMSLPVPDIGENFEEIFNEVIKVNTLDNETYKEIQQNIIDVLDQGDYVLVKGKNGNLTDMKVMLHELKNPGKETNFENCIADVNIPVGEVFTSPVLTGTCGTLNVSHAYLEGYEYKNLVLKFKDGKVTSYNCENFDSEEENKNYIYENVMFRHDWLPIGEFAIGTNTTAYAMANKFGIWKKLPILIAEKTGPHFAVGDTCYSDMEEVMTYNPDGKAIIARANEVSDLRHEDRNKAYFNCHTDITIPYDELDYIRVVNADGSVNSVIEDGKFVVPGTEVLNSKILCP